MNSKYPGELPLYKANQYVKKILQEFGYSNEVELCSHISDENATHYAIDYITYHGKRTKKITVIPNDAYVDLLKRALEKEECTFEDIRYDIKNGKETFSLLSYNPYRRALH